MPEDMLPSRTPTPWKLLLPQQVPPMIGVLTQIEFAAFVRGFDLYGRPSEQVQIAQINGYLYRQQVKAQGAAVQAWEANPPESLAAAAAQPLAYWQQQMLPELQQALARLESVDLSAAPLQELQACLQGALALDELIEMRIQPIALMQSRARLFRVLHEELLGSAGPAHTTLLQGFDHPLAQVDLTLARLTEMAAADPWLRATVMEDNPETLRSALQQTPAGQSFLQELARLVHTHGRRIEARNLLTPTWQEEPAAVLRLIRAGLAADGSHRPVAIQAAEREQALVTVRQQLQTLPAEVQQRYNDLLRVAQEATVVREEHHYWMHGRCRSPLRAVLLAFAQHLIAAHRLAQPEDIWWLSPAELLAHDQGSQSYAELVAQRRSQWSNFADVTPSPELVTLPSA